MIAGLIAKKFGPAAGGLFLAFPAIFPAGACLVESHEREHKARAGLDGTGRGRTIAGIDAMGAAMGCTGLAGFAILCWLALPRMNSIAVFAFATLLWLVLSVLCWWARKRRMFRAHGRHRAEHAFRAS